MIKKPLLAILGICTLLALSGCEKEEAVTYTKDNPLVLTMAELNPSDTIVGQMDYKFKQSVEELSGGAMIINLYTDSILGDEAQTLEQMLGEDPTIQIYRASASTFSSYGTTKWALLTIPYTFASKEHFWNFAGSELAEEVLVEPHELGIGVRGLFFGEEGFRDFFTVPEVSTINDFKGLTIRVSSDPVMEGMVKGLGATPASISFAEVYNSLATGKCDAAEQPISNYKSNAFDEVAPTLVLDGHTLGVVCTVISDKAWDSLTKQQQDILMEAGKIASAYCHEISDSAEAKVLNELRAQGNVRIIEVNDITPWQEACKDIIAQKSAAHPELYQKILNLR